LAGGGQRSARCRGRRSRVHGQWRERRQRGTGLQTVCGLIFSRTEDYSQNVGHLVCGLGGGVLSGICGRVRCTEWGAEYCGE